MDPLAAWVETLPDDRDGTLAEEARAQAQDDLGEEITATRFGTHVKHSERWDKRRTQLEGVQGMRLLLKEGCRVADSLPGFSDSPVYIPNNPPRTLQQSGAEDVARANADVGEMQPTLDAETGDLPFHGARAVDMPEAHPGDSGGWLSGLLPGMVGGPAGG